MNSESPLPAPSNYCPLISQCHLANVTTTPNIGSFPFTYPILDNSKFFGQFQTKFLSEASFNIFMMMSNVYIHHVHNLLIYNHLHNGDMASIRFEAQMCAFLETICLFPNSPKALNCLNTSYLDLIPHFILEVEAKVLSPTCINDL